MMEVKWMTTHARDKYRKVTGSTLRGFELEEEILGIFNQAVEEEMNAGLLKRMMDNNFEWCKFFVGGNLRFTICRSTEGDYYLRTVEENRFKDKSLGYLKKEKRRRRRE